MKILLPIYEQIIHTYSDVPPEQGGIIGERDGIVCSYFHDIAPQSAYSAVYTPNIGVLNRQIQTWRADNIRFCGIVHSHPNGQITLSAQDQYYIQTIIHIVPNTISQLFFPIIIPKHGIYSYLVFPHESTFSIHSDTITIVKKGQ